MTVAFYLQNETVSIVCQVALAVEVLSFWASKMQRIAFHRYVCNLLSLKKLKDVRATTHSPTVPTLIKKSCESKKRPILLYTSRFFNQIF